MKLSLKFRGITEVDGEVARNYLYKNLSVIVTNGKFSYEHEKHVDEGLNVLHVSFRCQRGLQIKQSDVDYCLSYFGFDKSLPFSEYTRMSSGLTGYKFEILHYEQIFPDNKEQR